MKHVREMTDEVLQALSISLLAEGVAVVLAFAAAFVWIAIYSTRGLSPLPFGCTIEQTAPNGECK